MPSMNELDGMKQYLSTWAQAHLPARPRRGAAGKALIVYLFSGSLVTAIVAYLIFKAMGC